MTDNPFDHPDLQEFLQHAREELAPKIKGSDFAIQLFPSPGTDPDPKICIELGYMIMFNKPIILVVTPEQLKDVPPALLAVSKRVVEVDTLDTEEFGRKVRATIDELEQENTL